MYSWIRRAQDNDVHEANERGDGTGRLENKTEQHEAGGAKKSRPNHDQKFPINWIVTLPPRIQQGATFIFVGVVFLCAGGLCFFMHLLPDKREKHQKAHADSFWTVSIYCALVGIAWCVLGAMWIAIRHLWYWTGYEQLWTDYHRRWGRAAEFPRASTQEIGTSADRESRPSHTSLSATDEDAPSHEGRERLFQAQETGRRSSLARPMKLHEAELPSNDPALEEKVMGDERSATATNVKATVLNVIHEE